MNMNWAAGVASGGVSDNKKVSMRALCPWVDVTTSDNPNPHPEPAGWARWKAQQDQDDHLRIGCFSRLHPRYRKGDWVYGDFYLVFDLSRNVDDTDRLGGVCVTEDVKRAIEVLAVNVEAVRDVLRVSFDAETDELILSVKAESLGVYPDNRLPLIYRLMASSLIRNLGLRGVKLDVYRQDYLACLAPVLDIGDGSATQYDSVTHLHNPSVAPPGRQIHPKSGLQYLRLVYSEARNAVSALVPPPSQERRSRAYDEIPY